MQLNFAPRSSAVSRGSRMLQELKLYHKLINIQLPKYLECFVYQTNLDLHNHNTGRGHRLHIPRINHAFAQLNIRHSVIQTVNSMPDNVIDKIRTHNLKRFQHLRQKTTSFRHMKLHVKSQIVIYVNDRPSLHIYLRNNVFIYCTKQLN